MTTGQGSAIFKASISVATLVAGLAAAVLGYFEYKAHQQETRVERVLRYSDAFHGKSEGYREHGATLSRFSLVYWNHLTEVGNTDAETFAVNQVLADPTLREALTTYTRFFDLLTVCVAEDMCDERSARALFIHDLNEFHNLAYPWLTSEHEQYGSHGGRPLMCLRKHFKETKPPPDVPFWQIGRPAAPCTESAE
jgi:hypothetical protein